MGRARVRIEGAMMRKVLVRSLLVAAGAASMVGILAGTAGADPIGSKNAFPATANCGTAGSFQVVVNSANGQGSGTQNGTQATFAPAHLIGSSGVFHPTAFNLTYSFDGVPQPMTNTASRPNQAGNVTCQINGSKSVGTDTFSISGTVTGWIS